MTEMLPISIREKNCFFQQLKSARIKFIPKLCCVLRLFDKHIPFLGYANFIIHTEKTFLWKQKKNEFIQIVYGRNMCKNIQDIVGLKNKM